MDAQSKFRSKTQDIFESNMEWRLINDGPPRVGYLFNMKTHKVVDENRKEHAAVLLYFSEESGQIFKVILRYEPYFYVLAKEEFKTEVFGAISRQFSGFLSRIEMVDKYDLDQPNHLSGITNSYIKLYFRNIQDLVTVRGRIKQKMHPGRTLDKSQYQDFLEAIEDTREHDVIYYTRVAIDLEIRCGLWYQITFRNGVPVLKSLTDKLANPGLRVLAFDLETYKKPLKFPDSETDPIMMVSYMIDGLGFLIINREILSQDVEDFEYTPRPEYEGKFSIFNEPTEGAMIKRFFEHIRETKPVIFVTYNGDFFDWPYLEKRAMKNGMNMENEIGIFNEGEEYKGRLAVHMDCLYWVKRDAYLPQGSHGLKKVTKAKLGYDPVELDPEEMVNYARVNPQGLCSYSCSDAVATYYLYKKMIHDFIFALCTIIPLYPDDVLRKGSGTLCEDLLMAQAYSRNIIFPNKISEEAEKFYQGNLIESETYIGGHVECIEVGVYRNDIPVKFKLSPQIYQKLINEVDDAISFCASIEQKIDPSEVANRDEVREAIQKILAGFRDSPHKEAKPLIYHLDVGAMYPNIILSNRLQPTAVVNEKVCASCLYNRPENNCKRKLEWEWRGEVFPLKKGEYEGVKAQLEQEVFNGVPFSLMPPEQQMTQIKERVKEYCKRAYNSIHTTKIETKQDTVCMRENSFYVDTVRAFRDRRYTYKGLVKKEAGCVKDAENRKDPVGAKEAEERMNLYESLQLAHKIILNSFYGYVMRKGARWYSMEMAGMVTHMGANIITMARELVEQIGKPLELDTDGIWCLLPEGFPENYTLVSKSGRKMFMSYPCTMLNFLIYDSFKNTQYQTLNEDGSYDTHTEMSVFFEIDGPYRAMILPASTEEGRMLKKRYAVFNMSGKLHEIKGFELKRRGELKLIKVFQEEIFDRFLTGSTLEECYKAAGEVADRWWDILEYQGAGIMAEELIEYLCENRTLSKSVTEYGAQKSTAITTARRLAEILGDEITKDKGLNCKMIISKKPEGAPVTERAVPAVVFSLETEVKEKFLKLWTKDNSIKDFTLQNVIDWDYYKERLGGTIQKILSITAILQKVSNPVPRVPLPDWLGKRTRDLDHNFKQKSIDSIFKPQAFQPPKVPDIEDMPVRKPETIPILHDMTNCPSFFLDFPNWLSYSQSSWKQRRKHNLALKKLRREGKVQEAPRSISTYLKNKDSSLLYSLWHVIGIHHVQNGMFKLWVYTEFQDLHCLTLEVKRKIYINSSVERENPNFKSVKMTLPHNKTCNYLYEYEMSEADFQDKFFVISNALADPQIEGVYETKIPIEILAIIKLGCILKPKIDGLENILEDKGNLLGHVFRIEDFEVRTDAGYLKDMSNLTKFYLLHVQAGVRGIWMLFSPAKSMVFVYIIMPGHNPDKPSMQRLVKECLDSQEWVCETLYPKNQDQAFRLIDKTLLQEKSGPSLVLFSSASITIDFLLKHGMASFEKDFPVINVLSPQYSLPALDWQKIGIQHLCQLFQAIPMWFENQLGFSRYSCVPIGNLPQDPSLFLCDLLFARSLKNSQHILWWSNENSADFGGEDDSGSLIEDKDFFCTEVCVPGLYSDISVELDLGVLPTNAILCYKHLFVGELIEDNPNDEKVVCLNSFRKIRSLINTWVDDVKQYKNPYADKLVMHSYRWIASKGSGMYDPLLHLTIHKLVDQLFKHLLAELQKLGAKIIFAHSDKIILGTGRYNLADAQNYCTFLVKSLTASPSFAYLSLEATRFWQIFFFKDNFNYAGIPISVQEKQIRIASHWHLLEMFPEDFSKLALVIIAQMLHESYTFLSENYESDTIRSQLIEFLKHLLANQISPKLFETIHNMQVQDTLAFPKKVGAIFTTQNAGLEFVKVIAHLLSLEPDLSDTILTLRKNLLRLLNYSDFAPEADYTEPCMSLILPEIICPNCVYTRDIDLCRDPMISQGIWKCYLCDNEFDKEHFELKLVELLQNKMKDYQNQDLQCVKCKMNKGNLLSRHCLCSGIYKPTRDAESFMKFLTTVNELSAFHEFTYLCDLIGPIVNSFN
ncbi:unnamed protein product [Blepharisma stoltei]|uniref:DNA polymerase epsilon catalytic subunit n=1 Tax=Blepharisma stoltei TaxID=1481888 RepID=A0AAU9I9M9_9CILI|nr:unnamed protein product [Blepharisma stoltei]